MTNEVVSLLEQILAELREMNGKSVEDKVIPELTHQQLQELCLEINRKTNKKEEIRQIIRRYTETGKLADVPQNMLQNLKTDLQEIYHA